MSKFAFLAKNDAQQRFRNTEKVQKLGKSGLIFRIFDPKSVNFGKGPINKYLEKKLTFSKASKLHMRAIVTAIVLFKQ